MVLKQGEGPTLQGVLNDWDMAKFVDDPADLLNVAHHRTGSPPFMAVELLGKAPTPHLYRHDLESFLYVLIWAAVHYNFAEKKRDKYVNEALVKWTRGKTDNQLSKSGLLSALSTHATDIRAAVKPDNVELWIDWIDPLRRLFIMAQTTYLLMGEGSDRAAYGNMVTFKKFMKVLTKKDKGYRTWGIPEFLENDV